MLPDSVSIALRSSWLRALVAVAVVLALLRLLRWREANLESFAHAFAHMRWDWTLAAVALNLLSALAGSLAWGTVIREAMPLPHPRYREVVSAFSVGLIGNILLPARGGEVVRIGVLARRLGSERGVWATLVGTVVAYRMLDLLPSLALIAYVLLFAPLPHWAVGSLVLVAALGVGLLAVGFLIARRHERPLIEVGSRIRSLAISVREGLGIFRVPLPTATATLYQCVAWLGQLLAVYATMRAFGLALPLAAAALVLALVNLAILFPLWPGNIGLVQAAVALPLTRYDVGYARGVAFGVGLQAIEVSVGVSLGLLFLAREGLSVTTLRRVPEAGMVGLVAPSEPLEVTEV